jgi:hypothetical protein
MGGWVDRESVTDHFLRKYWIGNLFDGVDDAVQGRFQDNLLHRA